MRSRTFMFSDIEGSTALWEHQPEAMRAALPRHDALLREAVEQHGGRIFKTTGDGCCAVFDEARGAVLAAIAALTAVGGEEWGPLGRLQVRIGIHTGPAEERNDDYFGPTLNRCARLTAAAHGGQALLSQAAADEPQPAEVELRCLGVHQLRDLLEPETLYQLVAPGLQVDFPPPRGLPSYATNLVRPASSFIGREAAAAEVEALLERARMLTMLGPGGTGKTRLALRVAADRIDRYPGGVWLVELAGLTEPRAVPQALAAAVQLREEPSQPLIASLARFFAPHRALVLLDNCEHLLDGVAPLVETLLARCPELHLLATSREVLRVEGEVVWPVPPLELPPERAAPAEVLSSEAGRLFVERATAASPGMVFEAAQAPIIAAICRALDGLPLALELAAARVRTLSLEAIAAQLADRYRLLTGGRRASPRHATLRAAIDWSYDLLSAPERLLFTRLSVFAGGFALPAAEAVCASGELPWEEIPELLSALVDKSLLRAHLAGPEPRYELLETLRAYGRERLGETEASRLLDAHLRWYADWAEAAEPQLRGPAQGEWMRRFAQDSDNLRAAIAHGVEAGAVDALRLAAASWACWYAAGAFSEGLRTLERAITHVRDAPPALLARAHNGAGNLATPRGDYEAAREHLEASLALRRAEGDLPGVAGSLNNLGCVARSQGDLAAARAYWIDSLAVAREAGTDSTAAAATANLGSLAFDEGDGAAARPLLESALATYRALGDQLNVARVLHNLCELDAAEGRLAEALDRLREVLRLRLAVEDRGGLANTLFEIGRVLLDLGDPHTAARLVAFEEAMRTEQGLELRDDAAAERRATREALTSLLGAAFEREWSSGRALALDEAVALADPP